MKKTPNQTEGRIGNGILAHRFSEGVILEDGVASNDAIGLGGWLP